MPKKTARYEACQTRNGWGVWDSRLKRFIEDGVSESQAKASVLRLMGAALDRCLIRTWQRISR